MSFAPGAAPRPLLVTGPCGAAEVTVTKRAGPLPPEAEFGQQGVEGVNVAGGMRAWAAAGRPMVSDAGEPAVL